MLGLDYEATLQILRHQQRVERMKPSAAVQREEQERHWGRVGAVGMRIVGVRVRFGYGFGCFLGKSWGMTNIFLDNVWMKLYQSR